MSFFLTYSVENAEYLLTPAGYAALLILLLAVFLLGSLFTKQQKETKFTTRQIVFCAIAMALAMVTSFIKAASLPFGGSVTLFSMFFISFIGYVYGLQIGLITGVAYGILQLLVDPYIYAPLQVLLDFPLAFGALGLSGIFSSSKYGLVKGYALGVCGRYLFHVLSGYIFFAAYVPETMNPLVYTFGYNATYILPEMVLTIVVLSIPAMNGAVKRVKQMAVTSG